MPTAHLKIRRGQHRDGATWSTFAVPFEPGESVLDGLRRIRRDQDATLAFRYSCINANACKECMVMVDGKAAYTCTVRLAPGEMVLEPLANKALFRDLVTEIAPPDERLDAGRID